MGRTDATSTARSGSSSRPSSRVGGRYARRPVLSFVVMFCVFILAFYAVTFVPYLEGTALPAYTRLNARLSTVLLNVMGEGATSEGTSVMSSRYQVNVAHGCDAVPPSILFISAVLAFPASLGAKLLGVLIGTVLLALINLARIISLFYTGIYFPKAFEVMHVDVWQPAFIVISLFLWVLWAWRVTQDRAAGPHVSVQAG